MPKSKVFFLKMDKIKEVPEKIFEASGNLFKANDFVAIKIHFGEKGNKGYIDPSWIKPVIMSVKKRKGLPFLTDTNTIYRGQRADAVHHQMIAHGHGFKIEKTAAPVIIADGLRGSEYIEVDVNKEHYKSVKIARGIYEAQSMIVLSHTKGHILSGFGGALKNLGMGCASKGGKYEMHSSFYPNIDTNNCVGCGECVRWCPGSALSLVDSKVVLDRSLCVGCGECILACSFEAMNISWDESSAKVQERYAEYALGAVKNKKVCYVNYMHQITRYCDCFSTSKEVPFLDNVGILVSTDPVAIDQASIDLINKKAGRDLFKEMNPKIDYRIQLETAEQIGLGSREYDFYD